MTIDQLEKMKTHELADMLANIVLVLRRMPDVECKQLVPQVPSDQDTERSTSAPTATSLSTFTRGELAKKKLDELKMLAKELNVLCPAKIKKDELIDKILAKPTDGRSEQRAIQDL
jgi:hypothetical protein